MNTKLRAVVFDMDGLLLDTERVALDAYLGAASELEISRATPGLYHALIGRNWQTTQLLLADALGGVDARRMVAAWKVTFEARIDTGGIPKKPGVDEMLQFLGDRATPLALATSTSRPLALKQLAAAGLVDHFGIMATGDEVAHGKPAPDIFLLAAERLGVDPGECLALEDSGPGVEAASRAGMRVIMVPDLVEPTPGIAALTERICSGLAEVQRFLDGILVSSEPPE